MVDTIYSVNDGNQYTVSDLMGMPKAIAKPIVDYLTEWDLATVLFRDAGPNNGSVLYEKDAAPFTEQGLETVAEFAEIPTTRAVAGTKVAAIAEKEGRALEISYEMREENQVGQVSKSITQLQNSALLSSTRRIKAVLEASDIPTVQATSAWTSDTAKIIQDVSDAIEQIDDAEVPGYENSEEAEYDFEATTMVMPKGLRGAFGLSDDVRSLYIGNIASENPLYKGWANAQFNGLNIVFPKFWYKDRILINSGTELGFYSDTRPLAMRGPIDKPENELVRYQLTRKRIVAVDTPKSAAWITGVKA